MSYGGESIHQRLNPVDVGEKDRMPNLRVGPTNFDRDIEPKMLKYSIINYSNRIRNLVKGDHVFLGEMMLQARNYPSTYVRQYHELMVW